MRALRQPALGLALVVLAARALPNQLALLSQMVLFDLGLPAQMLVLMLVQIVVSGLQLATGWQIVRARAAGPWFAGYFGASVVLTVVTAVVLRDKNLGPGLAIGSTFETLGFPVIVAVVSMFAGDHEERRRIDDVRALLVTLALSSLIVIPLELAQQVRTVVQPNASASIGGWIGMMVSPVIGLAIALVALVAAVNLERDPRERGRRALRVYVVAAIATHLAMKVLSVGWTLFEDFGERAFEIKRQLFIGDLIGLIGLVVPIMIWRHAREIFDGPDEPVSEARPSLVPIWIALTFAPSLFVRWFATGTLFARWGGNTTALTVALSLGESLAILGAGYAAMRRLPAARWLTLVAALGGLAIIGGGAFYVLTASNRYVTMGLIAPIGPLAASTLAAAWLHRKAA